MSRYHHYLRRYGYLKQHLLAISINSREFAFHLRADCPDGHQIGGTNKEAHLPSPVKIPNDIVATPTPR
jgi:hypothetical protein